MHSSNTFGIPGILITSDYILDKLCGVIVFFPRFLLQQVPIYLTCLGEYCNAVFFFLLFLR